MLKRLSAMMVATLLLSGCAATGASFSESVTPIRTDRASLVIYRPDAFQNSARNARVSVNNLKVAEVEHKGFVILELPPGYQTITVDMWDSPGSCSLQANLEPATRYYFEIGPRLASGIAGAAFGLIGQAIETSGRMCGGSYVIFPVEPRWALDALRDLKASQQ